MYKLSPEAIAAIEKYLNSGGKKDILVRIQDGKVIVLRLAKKRIA